MIDRVEIKTQSRAQLAGKVWPIFGLTLLANLVMGASQMGTVIPLVGFLVPIVVQGAIIQGIAQLYLNVTYGDQPKIEDVFSGFKNILNAALLTFLVGLFVCLWSLLFIIPGIVMAISYSMSWYIMCENPDMSAMDCIRESKSIMQGHKMEFFVMMLSFIGWCLLGTVTLGLAYIYVTPYMTLSCVNFYHRIKNVYSTDEGYTEISSEPVMDGGMEMDFNEPAPERSADIPQEPVSVVEPAFTVSNEDGETMAEPTFPDIPNGTAE